VTDYPRTWFQSDSAGTLPSGPDGMFRESPYEIMLSQGEVAFAPLRLIVYGPALDRASRDGSLACFAAYPYRQSRPRRWQADARTLLWTKAVTSLSPIDPGHHRGGLDAITIAHGDVHERVEQRIGKQVRLQSQLDNLECFAL
jgi:hypothetical protein